MEKLIVEMDMFHLHRLKWWMVSFQNDSQSLNCQRTQKSNLCICVAVIVSCVFTVLSVNSTQTHKTSLASEKGEQQAVMAVHKTNAWNDHLSKYVMTSGVMSTDVNRQWSYWPVWISFVALKHPQIACITFSSWLKHSELCWCNKSTSDWIELCGEEDVHEILGPRWKSTLTDDQH